MIPAKSNYAVIPDEVLEWTASQAIHRMRTGSITAERYASRLLERYRETKSLNAITWIDEGRVLESARAVDAARSSGKVLGPLAGLPIVIMDMYNTVGFPTTGGTPALKGNYPPTNGRVPDILFKNGAILLGKTNMHELGRGVTTSNPVFGATANPYGVNLVPGGGAGGTASAIAARISPAGLATDTAGSARLPAGLCGVVGLRPSTAGRRLAWPLGSWTVTTANDGILPIAYALTSPAPMGRSVSDVALLNAIVTGTRESPAIPLRGVRIGVPRGFYWENLDPEVERVSEMGLALLRDAGVNLIDVDLAQFAPKANATFLTLATMNNHRDLADFLTAFVPGVSLSQLIAGVVSRDVQAALQGEAAQPIPPAVAEQAENTRLDLAFQYEELLRTNNLTAIVVPTVPVLAPPIRPEGDGPTDTIPLNGQQVPEFGTLLRNTLFSGVVGVPALAIPAGLSASGLPVGLSFNGLTDSDNSLLGLGLSIEAALGRLPGPAVRPSASQNRAPSAPEPAPQAASSIPASGDDVDRALGGLRASAYLNFLCMIDQPPPTESEFKASVPLRRYDTDFRIGECGSGMRAVNLLGGECGHASLHWTFQQPARAFTMDDIFVFGGEDRLHGTGSGSIAMSPLADGRFAVNANGDILDGTGMFAGVQGSYVLTGSWDRTRNNLHFTMRLMDTRGAFLSGSDLPRLNGEQLPDPSITCMAFLGEPDPDHPVQLTPTGAIVSELLRAVHTDFDRRRHKGGVRATTMLGPIVARWRTSVTFNPAGLSGSTDLHQFVPVLLPDIRIEFCDAASGTLQASITDGRTYGMKLSGLSGPQFRMTGFGPIGVGTGRFQTARGMISMLGAIDLVPAAFSNYYVLHLFDPDKSFRC